MIRDIGRLNGWHFFAVGLLFTIALLGVMFLVPLLFLIPATRCASAGKSLNRNVPGAEDELRRGHSIGMGFLTVGATLVGVLALGNATVGRWDAFVIFLLLSSAGFFGVFASWMALEGTDALEPRAEPAPRQTGPTAAAVQTSLPRLAVEPDEDIEQYAEGLRLGTRVNWHSYVCSTLLLLVCTFLPLSALAVVTFCSAGVPPPPLSPLWMMVPPLALFAAAAFCLLAGTNLSWLRAAHTATFWITASLAVLGGIAALATLITTSVFWWYTSLEIIRALAAGGVVLMAAIAFGSSRVLRALPLLLLAGRGGPADAPDPGRSCESVHGDER